ncbi:MAG: cysteine hydrolase [Candidatus Aminicenantes bacterium]|nr:cysteine hydrolase [Candidatus Aminicenantes bacterium]
MAKIKNENRALLIIDMLRDFLEPDGALFCGEKARRIIPFVAQQIEAFHQKGDLVIFICDSHKRNDPEFKLFKPHCLKGTKGAQIIPELPVNPKDIIVSKTRYSAFYQTNLEDILKRKRINKVFVAGVCTSICVMDTVGDLRNRDYEVYVLRQGVADFNPRFHRFALERMAKIYGAKII